MDEHDAIRRLKHGDLSGLEWLVVQYQVKAVRTAYLITRDAQMAEDIVQEAFINVYRRIHQFDETRLFSPWFLRSVVNSAVKTASRQMKQVPLETEPDGASHWVTLATEGLSPEEQVESSEFQRVVWQAMEKLSARQRAAVVQRYFLGMSEKEMAGELGAARGTVKWLLNAARKNLRALLGSERKELL